MKDEIRKVLEEAKDLREVSDLLINFFGETKIRKDYPDIWYVSGIITSDGPDFIERNIKNLSEHTEKQRSQRGPYVFSPTDVFNDELFARIDAKGAKGEDYMQMWRRVLESRLIDGVIFTPRWGKSKGAIDEYETAKRLGLEIVDLESI